MDEQAKHPEIDDDQLPLLAVEPAAATVAPDEAEQEELMQVRIGGEEFLVAVNEVSEIIRPVRLTKVTMAPDHLLGVANVHGHIVCIIDASKVMHLGKMEAESDRTRFVILRHPRMHLGIRVDEVSRLYRIRSDMLPERSEDARNFSRGEIDIKERRYRLLNVPFFFN